MHLEVPGVKEIWIGKKRIGLNSPCFIIAEAGVNHNGSLKMALELIDRAVDVGADAIKFSLFKAEEVVTLGASKAEYQKKTTDAKATQFQMLKEIELERSAFGKMMQHAKKRGIEFIAACHSKSEVDYLYDQGIQMFKVPSYEIVEHDLLSHIAKKNRPVIVSTGMASLGEIEEAIEVMRQVGNEKIVLLQCTTNYPSLMEECNLRVLDTYQQCFGILVGYSDHTVGSVAAIGAVARGAVMIEKHFTLDNNLPGPDHLCSLNPVDFGRMIKDIRSVEKALGSEVKKMTDAEKKNIMGMRRSMRAARPLKAGECIREDMICVKRPNDGLSPRHFKELLGKKLARSLSEDQPIKKGDVTWEM